MHQGSSITAPVTRSVSPPLICLFNCTIELCLPQSLVHVIMPLAQPLAQRDPPTDVWRMIFDIRIQVRGTMRARVEYWQRPKETEHVGTLVRRRALGIVRGRRMQERPGRPTQLLDVGRAMLWTSINFRLRCKSFSRRESCHHRCCGLLTALLVLALWAGLFGGFPLPERGANFARLAIRAEYHSRWK